MRRTRIIAMLLTTAVLFAASVVLAAPGASAHHDRGYFYHLNYVDYQRPSNPCPRYSIQDVLDDQDGDWDRDRVSNAAEIYVAGGLNPCVYDSTNFCNLQPQFCYDYVYSPGYTCASGYWSWSEVNANPWADWDGDGVSNYTEAVNGANPCVRPCPSPTRIDVALNPNADWDGDGVSNATEVRQGTRPCDRSSFVINPCPYWNQYHVRSDPYGDWDRDGHSNHYEVSYGWNPCSTQQVRLPHVTSPPPQRLPHVVVAPTPAPRPLCPAGYPYYHPGNGKCYANPINPWG